MLGNSTVFNPLQAMDYRAQEWSKIWVTDQLEWPRILALLENAYDVSRTQTTMPPNYSLELIKCIIKRTNINKGYGADGVTAGFFAIPARRSVYPNL